jgi:hypothetical protein
MILRDNALTAFEASLEESQDSDEDDAEEVLTLTTGMIDVDFGPTSARLSSHTEPWIFRSSGWAEQSGKAEGHDLQEAWCAGGGNDEDEEVIVQVPWSNRR